MGRTGNFRLTHLIFREVLNEFFHRENFKILQNYTLIADMIALCMSKSVLKRLLEISFLYEQEIGWWIRD